MRCSRRSARPAPRSAAAIEAQRALAAHAWPKGGDVRVRMGLHTGEAHLAGDDYGGFDVNRGARIAAVGHGEQIVLSETTRSLVESALPAGVRVRDLGRHALKDIPVPEHLFQLDVPGLRTRVPARPGRPVVRWQPARSADDVRRAFGGPRRARWAARRPPAGDADRTRRDRQDQPRDRARTEPRDDAAGRRLARGARRRRPTRRW